MNIMHLVNALPGVAAQGLIWGIMAIGVYITFRILDVADLTVDGTMATGGAAFIMLTMAGAPGPLAMLGAFLAGVLAGLVTGLFHTACGIPAILAGILTQLALYSVNLRIMGQANRPVSSRQYDLLVDQQSVRSLSLDNPILVVAIFVAAVIALLYWFFGTELGASLRATGSNPNMSRAQGINTNFTKVLAQYQGFADVNMGRGAIVIGLAAVIIGEVIFGKVFRNFALKMLAVAIGAILYYLVYQVVIWLGLNTDDMKLITALIVAAFLAIPYWKGCPPGAPMPEQKQEGIRMLEIKEIWKTFNAGTVNEKQALRGVSLTLKDGDFCTVIGGNGAGKSTMLNAVAGTFSVDSGAIVIDGVDVTRLPEHKRAAYIGRVFQDPMMGTAATMQIDENLALAARRGAGRTLRVGITKKENAEYHELLKTLGLGLEDRMTSKVGLLSGGQRQAVTLLMATLKKPKLLLLDEHTAALDPKTAAKVLEISNKIVQENHLTTLMITHNMRDAIRYGNRLIMMNEGHVIYDVRGEEKTKLEVSDLLQRFEQAGGEANDRMILS